MFHKNSPYYKVCADVVLVNPPGVVADHTHTIEHKYQLHYQMVMQALLKKYQSVIINSFSL